MLQSGIDRPTLHVLKLIGEGLTTRVYLYKNRVYKYTFSTSVHTDFATRPGVMKELLRLDLVLPEQKISKDIIAVDYCPVVDWDLYTKNSIYNIKLQLLLTHFADVLATSNIYGMDLHLGNIGKHPTTGKYYIIDTEGFILCKNEQLHAKTVVVVNGQLKPTVVKHRTWLSIFDAVEGWYANHEMGTVVNTYVQYMEKVQGDANKRLRRFVSHYLLGDNFSDRRHLLGGLKLLQITSVYHNANQKTRLAVDTFLSYYMGSGYLQIASKQSFEIFDYETPLLCQKNYEIRVSEFARMLNDAYPPNRTTSLSIFWKAAAAAATAGAIFGAAFYGTSQLCKRMLLQKQKQKQKQTQKQTHKPKHEFTYTYTRDGYDSV